MTDDVLTQEQPTAKPGFIEVFLGTLVAPVQTFRLLAADSDTQIPAAFGIVILVFAADALRITPAKNLGWALFNVPGEISGGLFLWWLSVILFSLTAACFGAGMRQFKAAIVTLAWSLLPWIFLGPIACYGKLLGRANILLLAIPLIWILFLQIIAIKQSFEMKAWQALALVLLVPPILASFQLMQFVQTLTATLGSLAR